jgi:hypothetical protein
MVACQVGAKVPATKQCPLQATGCLLRQLLESVVTEGGQEG